MRFHPSRRFRAQVGGLALLAALFLGPARPAPAYLCHTQGGNNVFWQAGSPTGIWTDATKTMTWHYDSINFPQQNWPQTAAEIGAAFQHGYQTLQDVSGTNIFFSRGPDTNHKPMTGDGIAEMTLVPTETSDYFNMDISGAFAVTYWLWDANGVMQDADIEVNGDKNSFTWATSGPPPPANSNDIQLTVCHEQIHSVGGGHPVYFYAMVWPEGRVPEEMMFDRCLSPDDRNLMRTLYPAGTPFSTISGTVTLTGGGACDRAVVVATDANGVPQATVVTDAAGNYTVNVPPGTGYSMTAHNHVNSTYNSDTNFAGSTDFVASGTVSGVNASANISGVNFTVTAGTPDLTLTQIGYSPSTLGTQTLFLPKGSSGAITLEITTVSGNTLSAVSNLSLGPGITVGAVTPAPTGPGVTDLTFNYTVAAGATAGVRNLSFQTTVTGTQNLFLPSYVEVLDTGSISVAPGAGNPGPKGVGSGALDVPLLGLAFTAGASEDVRIRQLSFDIAGTGPQLPAVRLWIDRGTLGMVDAADIRLFTGNAYAASFGNATVTETLPVTVPGPVLFDNLVLTIPAGQTVNLLLTADMPATGTGSYTASFDPLIGSNIIPHGMFWGDVITPGGTTVTGGTVSVGGLAIGGLSQIRTTAGTVIPVGGATAELQVTLRGIPTDFSGQVGMDVEVKPLGQAFTNVPSGSVAATNASGTTLSVTVGGLTNLTSYHWQVRPVSSVTGAGAWVSFGGNPESAADFSVDTTTTTPPSALAQFQSDGVTAVPLGGPSSNSVVLQATSGTNSGGGQVQLQFEVEPTGTVFTNVPNLVSAFGPGGAVATASFAAPTGDYHWQVRSADVFGAASTWVAFNVAPTHFHLNSIVTIKASTGCIAATAAGTGVGPFAILAVMVSVLAAWVRPRGGKRTLLSLLCLLSLAGAAQAADDTPLPRALAELEIAPSAAGTGSAEVEPLFPAPEPAATHYPGKSWLDLDAYLGFLFMDMKFDATGTDMIRRTAKGDGAVLIGAEGMVTFLEDFGAGLCVEADFWSNMRILAAGPEVRWRFSASHPVRDTGRAEMEHFVKLGLLYEKLTVTKQDFGSFNASFGVRAGYTARISVAQSWAVDVGLDLQYAKWKYSPAVTAGNTSIGGFGGLLFVGLTLIL